MDCFYQDLGGEVISWGKPNEEFFEIAMNRVYEIYVDSTLSPIQVGSPKNRKNFRVLHIGDSIHHDIAGKNTIVNVQHVVHPESYNAIY